MSELLVGCRLQRAFSTSELLSRATKTCMPVCIHVLPASIVSFATMTHGNSRMCMPQDRQALASHWLGHYCQGFDHQANELEKHCAVRTLVDLGHFCSNLEGDFNDMQVSSSLCLRVLQILPGLQ